MDNFDIFGYGEKIKMNKQKIVLVLIILLSVALGFDEARAQPRLPLIDAHSQFDHHVEPGEIVPLLNRAGIAHVILATRGRRSWRDLSKLAQDHPTRVTASVRTKSGAYINNRKGYYRKLEAQLSDPTFKAIAEVLFWHAAKGSKAPEIVLYPDAPQVRVALDHALQRGWPFVMHIEFRGAAQAGDYDYQMRDLKSLLSEHPNHPFALTHMGQLSAEEARELIEAHPNIHFLTSHANEILTSASRQPWTTMADYDGLKPAWRELIAEHPSRFILAFDNVWPRHWSDMYVEQAELWRNALGELPPDIAHAIAHRNAERLWKLTPLK